MGAQAARDRLVFKVHKNLIEYNTDLFMKLIELKIERYAPKNAFIHTRLFEFDGDNFIKNKVTVLIEFKLLWEKKR